MRLAIPTDRLTRRSAARATASRSPRPFVAAGLLALVVVPLLVAVVVTGWTSGAVSAHAQLLSITPANDELLASAPSEVVLQFNEPVSLSGGRVRVLDDVAEQVSSAPVTTDSTITVPLAADLRDGTYTITYEVVSADSHRIAGASVFHVGTRTNDVLADVADPAADIAWGIRLGAVGFSVVGYAGALVAAGVYALTVYGDRTRSLRRRDEHAGDDLRRRWDGVVVRAAVLGAVGLIASAPFRIARVGGGLDALRDNDVIRSTLRGPIGLALVVTVVGLLAVAVAVDQRAPSWLGGLFALGALVGFVLEGHTRAERESLMIVGDVVHLAAGAVWAGGIAGLIVAFRSGADVGRLAPLVRRFSNAAVGAVFAVSVTGVLMAWVILPKAGELASTGWGNALIVKVALVVIVIGLGAYNNRRLVAAVATESARRRLGRMVMGEAAILLAVVAVTGVLVTRSPLTSDAAPPAAEPTVLTVEMSDGGSVELSIAPSRVGTNTLHLVLRDDEGRIVNPVEDPTVELTQPELDIGPLRPELTAVYIGEYQANVELSYPGAWTIDIRVRVSDFDSVSGSTAIEVDG